jgi:hypothetical protein
VHTHHETEEERKEEIVCGQARYDEGIRPCGVAFSSRNYTKAEFPSSDNQASYAVCYVGAIPCEGECEFGGTF